MVCPVAALALSFLLGSASHANDFYTYRWSCGVVHLPSISRVINMPLERTIFQLLILYSVPLRLIILFQHCKLLTHCLSVALLFLLFMIFNWTIHFKNYSNDMRRLAINRQGRDLCNSVTLSQSVLVLLIDFKALTFEDNLFY
ncbi:unnamed protein product [Angiostrongylus costaricensis]|uniref:G_PROTEIN_RECEP_F1_2 domain-containing protein n=1 Tax=Angiostrongylus costaricensis TaxID=334426 RepID=A0A0R3PVA7_ANGCS|nr:unnamed protein product [Angiostrongylus costaricensis]